MNAQSNPYAWWLSLRKLVGAVVWLVLPALTLVGSRCTPWQSLFRGRPFNDSYDAMFIAATAGAGLTALWSRHAFNRRDVEKPALPAYYCSRNAFDLFELFACLALGVCSFLAGVPGSGVAWTAAFVGLVACTSALWRAEQGATWQSARGRTVLALTTSAFLVACAALFVIFPVLQPWSGPPELFVRWYPFSPPVELIWRGFFLSFAFGMVLAAFDPLGRHRSFLLFLALSGYLHSGEMLVDNRLSASGGGMNGNPEHLYGDVLGWFVIASFSLLVLVLDRARGGAPRSERREALRP